MPAPVVTPLPKGETLYRHDRQVLVRATEEDALALARAGYRLQRISHVPKPLTRASVPTPAVSAGYDSTTANIIAQVSADTLERWVQRLQDSRTRYTYSDSIRKAAQWILQQYVALGLTDVEFDTFYVSGVPHFNVIATKRDLIYPDSVIMIGGHDDSLFSAVAQIPWSGHLAPMIMPQAL